MSSFSLDEGCNHRDSGDSNSLRRPQDASFIASDFDSTRKVREQSRLVAQFKARSISLSTDGFGTIDENKIHRRGHTHDLGVYSFCGDR
jgi:hypothetical protein